jgi:hypothetical protein
MRKVLTVAILCLVVLLPVCAISINHESEDHPFDSAPMLDRFFDLSDDGNLPAWNAYKISLLTISKGSPLYSWFGHSALVVETPDHRRIAFDYGTFSFSSDRFISNFVMGRLWFVCLSSSIDYRLEEFEEEGRGVSVVELPLTVAQKKAVINFLNENTDREHREYLYHHYKDNCATRLRDIIDRATKGNFKRWAQSQSGLTYRQQASRGLSTNRFVQWALEFLQSSVIDIDATLWDEMFLPDVLEKAVMEYFHVGNEVLLEGSAKTTVPDKPQSNILFSVILGLVLGGISFVLWFLSLNRAGGIFRFVICLVFGILGSILLFMMLFTNHDVTWYNENILFVNPLLLVLAVLSLFRKERIAHFTRTCFSVLFGLVLVLVILKLLLPGLFFQQNWPVIITMALFYLPNAFNPRRKTRESRQS